MIITYSCADDDNNTTTTVPIRPSKMPVQSEDDHNATPTYAYYIIGIGGAVLMIALALVICCCGYTCYVKWNNAKQLPPLVKYPLGTDTLYSVSKITC